MAKSTQHLNFINNNSDFVVIDSSSNDKYKKLNLSKVTDALISDNSDVIGEKGDKGEKGFRGRTGQKGEPGEIGNTGENGVKGEKGVRGIIGDIGEKGEKGEKGSTGDTGIRGDLGEKGEFGADGIVGQTGDKGLKGKKGEIGNTGLTGIQGIKGVKGNIGDTLNGYAIQGDAGEPGDPAFFARRGDRGLTGERGLKGEKGQKGQKGNPAVSTGNINHALFGAKVIRNWEKIDITSGPFVHLSYFKNGADISYKYIKLVVGVPQNNNLLQPTSTMVVNLINHGIVTNYIPILSGLPPVVWIKSESDTDYTNDNRNLNRTPRNVVLNVHADGEHIGVYIPTDNSQHITSNKIDLNIIEMYGTNDI